MDTVNDFLMKNRETCGDESWECPNIRPRIVCADGFSLSVQASNGHYCTPRSNYGPYSRVEVGYPSSRPPEAWRNYSEKKWQRPGLLGTIKVLWDAREHIMYQIRHREWRWIRCMYLVSDNATNGVYPYVPVEMVDDLIASHGGIDYEKTKEEGK